MKYMQRDKLFKGANVDFDPATYRAHSYGWWRFVDMFDGLVVFNNYAYSVTTQRHQRKVRDIMRTLGVKIDLEIDTPKSLKEGILAIESAELRLRARVESLVAQTKVTGTRKEKNEKRLEEAKKLTERADSLATWIKRLKRKEKSQ